MDVEAKPFLKWAGGKTQLINELESRLPSQVLKTKKIEKYFEPFIGGGAFYFYLMSNYKIKESYLSDINPELILTYNVIKNDVYELINLLSNIREEFIPKDFDDRKEYFLTVRKNFNSSLTDFDFDNYSHDHIERASQTIFMNKTCFNGLFRLNKKGEFNVPFGKYKNPAICDEDNLIAVSKILKNTKIFNASYEKSEKMIDENSLVYLDPPYRPLTNSANFTTYSKSGFNDDNQIELSQFFKRIADKEAKVILSNSDPKNADENDNFFDDLYSDFLIERVRAKRFINRDSSKRGPINEIIVRNYGWDNG